MSRLWGMGPRLKPKTPATPPRFKIGDIVMHKISGERGAVVGIEMTEFEDPATWTYELGLSFKDGDNTTCGEGELQLDAPPWPAPACTCGLDAALASSPVSEQKKSAEVVSQSPQERR